MKKLSHLGCLLLTLMTLTLFSTAYAVDAPANSGVAKPASHMKHVKKKKSQAKTDSPQAGAAATGAH